MHIYLIRHGEKEATKNNPGLTTTGITQAQKTAQYLAQFPITKIIASPYLRTKQTAEYIAEHLNLPVATDYRLRERMDFQEFVGEREDFFEEWLQATHKREYIPITGRSSLQTGQDVYSLIEELNERDEQHIAVITHGGAIADFLRTVFNEKQIEELLYEFAEGTDYRVDECSVTVIRKDNENYLLLNLHCIEHLKGLQL